MRNLDDLNVEGLTPETTSAIKENFALLENEDFSSLASSELIKIQEFMNTVRFFLPLILIEEPILDLIRITKNPRGNDGWPMRIHRLSRLKYPPADKTNMGRANFAKSSVLYASFFGLTSELESRMMPGDLLTRSEWRMHSRFDKIRSTVIFHDAAILKNMPYYQRYHEAYRAMLEKRPKLEAELMEATNNFVARQFTKKVPPDKKANYLISAFVASMLLNQNGFDAVVYPSVQLQLYDACIAMRTDVFDNMFFPVKCTELLVNSIADEEGGQYYSTKTGVAMRFDKPGDTIVWDLDKSIKEADLSDFQKQRAEDRKNPT